MSVQTVSEMTTHLHELLCDMQRPAGEIYNTVEAAADAAREDETLILAAHRAQALFEYVVSAACSAAGLLKELEEVKR